MLKKKFIHIPVSSMEAKEEVKAIEKSIKANVESYFALLFIGHLLIEEED